MNLLFQIPPKSILDTYRAVQTILNGHESIIFRTLGTIDRGFQQPIDRSQYELKHTEIQNKLKYTGALRGRETAMKLLQGVWKHVEEIGGIQGVSNSSLIESLFFKTTKDNTYIRLTNNGLWAIEWSVSLNTPYVDSQKILLEHLHFCDNGEVNEVVPIYILEYIGSALNCFNEGMNAVAVALVSIAMEATLRDILAKRGYTFTPGASAEAVYPFSKADIEVVDESYKLTFHDPMPKPATLFTTSTGGSTKVEVDIKRKVHYGRMDLVIKSPEFLLDHLSIKEPSRGAVKTISGLGKALSIARDVENILTPDLLPPDFDEVITGVRNPLIHLSEAALTAELESFNGELTLGDFLRNPEMVYDLITNVPRFINEQYLSMYRSNVDTVTTTT
jgi:hypothetical protein